MERSSDDAPRVRDALGTRVPPTPVVRAATRARTALGRAHDAMAPPPQLLLERLFGLVDTKALFCAVELELPDLLHDGARASEDLAASVGADPDAVFRLLRFLVSRGFFEQDAQGRFANNAGSDILRRDHPFTWRPWVEFFGSAWNGRIWDRLPERVRTGTPAAELAFSQPFFDYLHEGNPAAGEAFDAAMAAGSPIQALLLPDRLLEGVRHVCDVGGGTGGVLVRLLQGRPALHGTVFDLDALGEAARQRLEEGGVADRATFAGGSFFDAVPAGCDLYTLFAVIHDWDDAACRKILRNVADAMTPGGRILVVERPIPPGSSADFAKTSDLLMLVLGEGGRERTAAEYEALFASAGLIVRGRTTLPSLFRVYELTR